MSERIFERAWPTVSRGPRARTTLALTSSFTVLGHLGGCFRADYGYFCTWLWRGGREIQGRRLLLLLSQNAPEVLVLTTVGGGDLLRPLGGGAGISVLAVAMSLGETERRNYSPPC